LDGLSLNEDVSFDTVIKHNTSIILTNNLKCFCVSLYLGYVFLTNIPVGATDIQIIERRKTENILGQSFIGGSVKILLWKREQ